MTIKIEVPEKKTTTHNCKDTMKRNQPKRKTIQKKVTKSPAKSGKFSTSINNQEISQQTESMLKEIIDQCLLK